MGSSRNLFGLDHFLPNYTFETHNNLQKIW